MWLGAFALFVLRLRSFHALEQDLRRPKRGASWLGRGRVPSAETLGRVLGAVSLPELRELVATVNRRAWRAKAIHRRVRVVWAEEETRRRKRVGGRGQEHVEQSTWVWVTDLPLAAVGAATIQRWGHDRWDLENRGFNELGTLWHMDHCFLHEVGAVEALLLTLAVAFLTTYLFYARNLKPPGRQHLTRLALAGRLLEDLAVLAGATAWPASRGP